MFLRWCRDYWGHSDLHWASRTSHSADEWTRYFSCPDGQKLSVFSPVSGLLPSPNKLQAVHLTLWRWNYSDYWCKQVCRVCLMMHCEAKTVKSCGCIIVVIVLYDSHCGCQVWDDNFLVNWHCARLLLFLYLFVSCRKLNIILFTCDVCCWLIVLLGHIMHLLFIYYAIVWQVYESKEDSSISGTRQFVNRATASNRCNSCGCSDGHQLGRRPAGRLITDRVLGSGRLITQQLSASSSAAAQSALPVGTPSTSSPSSVPGAAMRSLLLLILLSSTTADTGRPLEKILKLNRSSFDGALREHRQLLVHFCKRRWQFGELDWPSRWPVHVSLCADSAETLADYRVAEAFDGAASELQGSEVTAAAVDVSEEKELAKELDATGHASIRLYLDGDRSSPEVCPGTWRDDSLLLSSSFFNNERLITIVRDLLKNQK